MTLAVLGLNHKSSRLEFREIIQRNIEDIKNIYSEFARAIGCNELVVLSTCNRIEIYFSTNHFDKSVAEIERFLLANHAESIQEFRNSSYLFRDDDMIRHCFTVAPGLDSMILGEPEILGQMKQAFQTAREQGTLRGQLLQLFEKAFQVAKEVRTETDIGKGTIGTASVSMELAQKVCGSLVTKSTFILGGGKLAEKLINHLIRNGCPNISVSTRRVERGQELEKHYSVRVVPFLEWPLYLAQADLFISATTHPSLLLTAEELDRIMTKRKRKPLCLIDLAVPRTIDPNVVKIEGIHAYNIEDLKGIGYQNLKFRESAMAQAYTIIDAKAKAFLDQLDHLRTPNFSKMVSKLNELIHECVHEEVWPALEPYLVSDEERETVKRAVYQLERNLTHSLLMRLKTHMLEEKTENSDFLLARFFQNETVQFNLPDALKKYPDHFFQELKKRFHQEILSLVTS